MERGFYTKISYKFTKGFVPHFVNYFKDIKRDLKRADINISLKEYIGIAIFSSILTFIFTLPSVSIIVGILVGGVNGLISGLIAGFFISLFLSTGVFMSFYVYPSIKVSSRKKKIKHTLPFATLYLSTIAGTGTPPAAMFKLLANFKEYGEVSKEAEKISRDVHSFGADISSALRRAADRTPSEEFRELLWGMNNIISSGGDLRTFLRENSEQFMNEYRRDLDKFSKTLSVLVEIYITLIVVGSVFLIVLSSIMSPLGINTFVLISIQIGGIFVFLPLASIMFIIMIKGVSPLS